MTTPSLSEQESERRQVRNDNMFYCLLIGGILCVLIIVSAAAVGIIATAPSRYDQGIQSQLDIMEEMTGSEVVFTSIWNSIGMALTQDGQVCLLDIDSIECIKDFHDAVSVRFNRDEVKYGTTSIHIYQYLILSRDGIVYRLFGDSVEDLIISNTSVVIKDNIYNAVTTWTMEELVKSGPVKYYQPATILGDGILVIVGNSMPITVR